MWVKFMLCFAIAIAVSDAFKFWLHVSDKQGAQSGTSIKYARIEDEWIEISIYFISSKG